MTQTRERLKIPRDFAPEQSALIRTMEDDGWTGRITANGHALMRAPANGPTCTFGPKTGSRRSRGNNQAVYKAWKRDQSA